jgi:hypothetical protein
VREKIAKILCLKRLSARINVRVTSNSLFLKFISYAWLDYLEWDVPIRTLTDMRPVVRQCTFSLKNVQLILVHILHIGKHNKKISILTVISFLLICYIMKLAIIKTVRVNVHKRTTSFSSTTRITCSSDMIKENSSVSRQDWDFRLFVGFVSFSTQIQLKVFIKSVYKI